MNRKQMLNGMTALVLILLINSFSELSRAGTIYVPSQQSTIQAGIDTALEGDTVLVAPGTYTGDGNRDIDFGGKNIVLKSEGGPEITIIDCEGGPHPEYHVGFYFHNGEDTTAVVAGFSIIRAYIIMFDGGAIRCDASSPKIVDCIISNNIVRNTGGAGIACIDADPIIENCLIYHNVGENFDCCASGGGILCANSNAVIRNSLIVQNTAGWGGGIHCVNSNPYIENCTISNNGAGGGWFTQDGCGGGIFCGTSSPTIVNSIVSFNGASGDYGGHHGGIYCDSTSAPILICSNVYGNSHGDWIDCLLDQRYTNANMSLNPLFCDIPDIDYHISSASRCGPENNDEGVLIGAWGVGCDGMFTCGDATGDNTVNIGDPVYLISHIFRGGPPPFAVGAGDANCDNYTDVSDAVYLINYIFKGGEDPCCP